MFFFKALNFVTAAPPPPPQLYVAKHVPGKLFHRALSKTQLLNARWKHPINPLKILWLHCQVIKWQSRQDKDSRMLGTCRTHTHAHRQMDGGRLVASCPAVRKAAQELLLHEKMVGRGARKERTNCTKVSWLSANFQSIIKTWGSKTTILHDLWTGERFSSSSS